MDLMDLLGAAGADSSIGKIADSVGIDAADTQNLIGALAPALMRSFQKQAESGGGIEALQRSAGPGDTPTFDVHDPVEIEDHRAGIARGGRPGYNFRHVLPIHRSRIRSGPRTAAGGVWRRPGRRRGRHRR